MIEMKNIVKIIIVLLFAAAESGGQTPFALDSILTRIETLHPRLKATEAMSQLFGEVWQWTSSSYAPYPGFRAVDGAVGEGLKDVLEEQALHHEMMSLADVEEIRLQMERNEASRLQPHFIRAFFEEAWAIK